MCNNIHIITISSILKRCVFYVYIIYTHSCQSLYGLIIYLSNINPWITFLDQRSSKLDFKTHQYFSILQWSLNKFLAIFSKINTNLRKCLSEKYILFSDANSRDAFRVKRIHLKSWKLNHTHLELTLKHRLNLEEF